MSALLPGLPSLPPSLSVAFASVQLLAADIISLVSGLNAPQWGIFYQGTPVVLADTVISLDFHQDFDLLTYPVEQGGFSTYNKVQKPFETKVRFATGGSDADRQQFLDSITAIIGDTNLYDVVSPEVVYTSVNLIHQDLSRTATNGAGLVTVDVWCKEVRATASAQFSSTQAGSQAAGNINTPQSPTASAVGNGGTVQATPTVTINSLAPATFAQRFGPIT